MSYPNRKELQNSLYDIIHLLGKPMNRTEMIQKIIEEYKLCGLVSHKELYRKLYTQISYELTELKKDGLICNKNRGLWEDPSQSRNV